MNQTQKNITEYKQKLPHLKEKLVAAALLFVITTSMLVTVTFAWVSLSTNPQVSEVNTSVAANGNLEIALATGTIEKSSAPGPSKVGDSSLDTLLRNVTWGNLINLNDSRYGLSNLVLRPSRLNDNNLMERPLYGPVYDGSGRVIDMNTNFGYSTWNSTTSRFEASDKLGVRAITSMTYGESGAQNVYNARLNLAEAANARFQTNYQSLAENKSYMDALASMMTGYMVQNILKVNSSVGGMVSDATLKVSDLRQFYSMYESLIACFEEQAEVYANLLSLQAEVNQVEGLAVTKADILLLAYDKANKTAYNKLLEMGFTTSSAAEKSVTIIKDIDSFLYDYHLLKADIVRVGALIDYITAQNKTSISWPNCPIVEGTTTRIIDDIINNLTNVGECTITGGDYTNLKIKNVGATAALNLKNAGVCETKITNGVLYNIDNRSGARIKNPSGSPLSLTVQVMGTQTIRSNVSTSATDNYFENERGLIADAIQEKYGAPQRIANDSYGYALDFWVRTNAANSYLTLQGNVLTRTESYDVKGKDLNGEEVQIYTITVKMNNEDEENPDEENQGGSDSSIDLEDMAVISYDVYYSTYLPEGEENEVECLRYADNHKVVTTESLGGREIPTPLKKVETEEIVIGFEGDNRVWEGEEHSFLTVSSTTQGSGSCYVFYPKTPVDQQKSIELLKHMKVAFVNANGELLATAYMDVERQYSTTGKVIVPLALANDATNIGTDPNGNIKYGITALEQNVPQRVTAVVYLDGKDLTNDMVLASADIEGTLNIQFGSSVALVPINNEELYTSELYAEVQSITPNEFDYDTLAENAEMTSVVKVRVTGTQPKTMTANFIRYINDTQGSPEGTFILTDEDKDGVWEGSYTFAYPGEYILTTVNIDGADRELRLGGDGEFPKVEIKGFSISSVVYSLNEFVMTDAPSYSGTVSLAFRTNDPQKMPTTVVGKFIREDGGAVNVDFAYNPTLGRWQGTANFVSSGVYTMQYVVLDNQYVELPESMQKTVDLTLGMRVNVETSSPTTIFYGDANAPASLKMQVQILDNNRNIVDNLAGASLVYTMTGTETLYSALVYNSGMEYYEGEFPVESGTWRFSHVSIAMGDMPANQLFQVNADSPVFTIVPPTPPSYVENAAESVQYIKDENGSANFTVTLKESGSATVYAKLRNKDDASKVIYLPGRLDTTVNDTYSYLFDMNQSGIWELAGISVFGVFDEDQNYHAIPQTMDEEHYLTGMIFDAASTQGAFVESQIVVLMQKDISISFNYDNASNQVNSTTKTVALGKDNSGNVTAEFMQGHTLANGAVTVTINDSNNIISRGYFDISDVSLSYKYGSTTDGSGNLYGGYTSDEYDKLNNTNVGTLKFVHSDGARFVLTSDGNDAVTFRYATQYVPDIFRYTVTSSQNATVNNTVSLTGVGAYKIEVYSKAPSVIISDISMDDIATYSVDTNTSGGVADTVASSSHREAGSGCQPDKYYKVTINNKHIHADKNTQYISKIVDANGNKATQGHTAYLYFKCNHTGPVESAAQYGCDYEAVKTNSLSGITGVKPHYYGDKNGNTVPSATLTLSGLGSNATKAELIFVNTSSSDTAVRLYTTYASRGSSGVTSGLVSSFEWNNGATTCKRYVGELIEGAESKYDGDTKTAAGTIKGTTLAATYDGKIYNFEIPAITINNPF